MKSVLISIQPKWCELIASGKKTIEVRKTRPKLKTPFKCYIYQTKKRELNGPTYSDGKVIGEFVCDSIRCFDVPYPAYQNHMDKSIPEQSCLTYDQLHRYAYHDALYGWHISDLVIYDEPKKLSEFYTKCDERCENCSLWQSVRVNYEEFDMECSSPVYEYKPLSRPPQSWCYVDEV